ncbi:MAG: Fe-S-containing hydro-lyase [Clostridium sp.]
MEKRISTPLTYDKIKDLKAGDSILLSGKIYTARDAAHKRLCELIENNKELPFDIEDSTIYYVGPSPTKPGDIIGSAGPTTSYRMDSYTPTLMKLGLRGMIGKGKRDDEVIKSITENKAIYFGAIGGAAALIANSITSNKIIAYEDLGAEAIRELVVNDMPLTIIIDSNGNNLYEIGKNEYLKKARAN